VPLRQLGERYADLPDADQTLVVCRVGSRSAYAAGFLLQQGVDAVNLAGGLVAWESAGRPLIADDDHTPMVL
jgi:rhodanese-related sulfurtransferase